MDIQDLSGLLKIVSEQNRLRLLCILRDSGEHCVCEFEEHLKDLSQSLISHHLADLKQAGLVAAEKRGLRMHYSLSEDGRRIVDIIFSLVEPATARCSNTNS
ncbi:MAG: metalloregulator ArsR/SmtB family transcription factor [Candidatus Saccharibacteria bacterium]